MANRYLIGFGEQGNKPADTIVHDSVGKPVVYTIHGESIYGVISEIREEEGIVLFQPSLVSDPAATQAWLITDRQTSAPLSSSAIIRPLPEGSLEKFVESYNKGLVAAQRNCDKCKFEDCQNEKTSSKKII